MKTRLSWGVLAMVGVVTFGACTDQGEDGDDGGAERSGDERTAVVELLTTSREVVSGLSSEAAATGTGILGVEDPTRPVDGEEARRQTDESVTALEAAVEAHGDEGGAYQTALDALGELGTLRAEVDARTEPPGVDQAAAAEAFYQRYSELTAPLLAANLGLPESIDDPEVQVGTELYATGLEQSVLGPHLASTIVTSTIADGLNTPEDISTVAFLQAQLVDRRTSITETADGTDYEAAAQALDLKLVESGFLDVTQRALDTGEVDFGELLDSAQVVETEGWPVFLDELEDILAG